MIMVGVCIGWKDHFRDLGTSLERKTWENTLWLSNVQHTHWFTIRCHQSMWRRRRKAGSWGRFGPSIILPFQMLGVIRIIFQIFQIFCKRERRAESREQRAESREQRAESRGNGEQKTGENVRIQVYSSGF